MAHYIDLEKLFTQIEKLFPDSSDERIVEGFEYALDKVKAIIDSLQQDLPKVDLDAIVNEAFDKYSSVDEYGQLVVSFNRAELYSFIKKIARKEENK